MIDLSRRELAYAVVPTCPLRFFPALYLPAPIIRKSARVPGTDPAHPHSPPMGLALHHTLYIGSLPHMEPLSIASSL